MKKLLVILTLLISILHSDTALLIKKGWQLIGSASDITDMSIFTSKNVEQIWHFNASEQKWMGYSPDEKIAKKIKSRGYDSISSLKSWHGFWIKSKKEWVLTFSQTGANDENIVLKKGWNLISIPVDTTVSPHIFDKMSVWKYSNDKWEFFDSDANEEFPSITHISNSDGIWVKSNKEQNVSIVTQSAKLHNFKDMNSLKAYIKDMLLINQRPFYGYFDLAVGSAITGGANEIYDSPTAQKDTANSSQGAEDASKTNLQEEGVDESDIVKHNNDHIFYLSVDPKKYPQMYVNVTSFENIAAGDLSPINSFKIEGYATDMYLNGDRLVVLSKYGSQNYKPVFTKKIQNEDIPEYYTPSMILEIFNVSDISNINRVAKFKIDGTINSSRVIGDDLYVIGSFDPYIRYTYEKIYVDAPECKEYFYDDGNYNQGGGGNSNESLPAETKQASQKTLKFARLINLDQIYSDKYTECYDLYKDEEGKLYKNDYDNPKIAYEKILPSIQKNLEAKKMLVDPKTFFAPDKKDQASTITTISKFDIKSATFEKSVSILGYSDTIYASPKAIYTVSTKYPIYFDFKRYKERSVVYKFDLDENLTYESSGFVTGRILNQFSLSEYNDILRIATTTGNSWQRDTVNTLYTLKSVKDSLIVQGVLSGLGKEGETIRSVRFLGDRGYVVTFRRTDPFYTIDLSDPLRPIKIGELKIDGFSSYLHPIDDTHILGFGRDATPQGEVLGLKMELFNIEDFANPKSVDSYTFPANYTRSEVEYNHKALAFRESDKLLAFAYQTYNQIQSNYLGVFQIDGDKISVFNPIKSSNTTAYDPYQPFQRGLIFDFADKTYIAYFFNGIINYDLLEKLKGK